jgi:hypothetical protein
VKNFCLPGLSELSDELLYTGQVERRPPERVLEALGVGIGTPRRDLNYDARLATLAALGNAHLHELWRD